MSNINCNVTNCYHSDTGVCHANKISINGKKSRTSTHTCCTSFIDTNNSSNLSSVKDSNPCSAIACNVKTCTHNAGNICVLNNVSVAANNIIANLSSETYCSSFKCK